MRFNKNDSVEKKMAKENWQKKSISIKLNGNALCHSYIRQKIT